MEGRTDWSGNWQVLIAALTGDKGQEMAGKGQAVAGIMKRLRPAMRKIGIVYGDSKHTRQGSKYFISRNPHNRHSHHKVILMKLYGMKDR